MIIKTEPQIPKIIHPYQHAIETMNRPSAAQSSVYYNIYDDIVNTSSASSKKSANPKPPENPLLMTFNPFN